MARSQSPPILSHLKAARSYPEQAAVLRSLKNEVVGHAQKKERWVELGVLEPIVQILEKARASGKANGNARDGSRSAQPSLSKSLTDDESVRLQALQLLSSFTNGGPSFLAPLHHVGALPVILSNIVPTENPPQVVLAALRALISLTEAAALSSLSGSSPLDLSALADTIFSPRYLDSLYNILASAPEHTSTAVQEEKNLVARLIGLLCRSEHHRNALANSGVLDALATILASFAVARGEAVPGAEIIAQSDGLASMIPDPAPPGSNLTVVLEAISTLIAHSRFRVCLLLCSPAILAVFPNSEFSTSEKEHKAAWNALEMAGLSSIRSRNPGAMDYLLPVVPVHQPRSLPSLASQFPPLGFTASRESLKGLGKTATKFSGWEASRFEPFGTASEEADDEEESPFIPWLVYLTRSSTGIDRVMAASILAYIFKAGFANAEREAVIGHLIVPLLGQLIKDTQSATKPVTGSGLVDAKTALHWAILEKAPPVLARLIADSEILQRSAHECGAAKAVSQLLKDAYEPLPAQTPQRPWTPNPEKTPTEKEFLPPSCRVGPSGQTPLYLHRLAMRESALQALAAMMPFNNEFRKAIVEQDVVPYIAESLTETPAKPKGIKDGSRVADKGPGEQNSSGTSPYGRNPNGVIIAAAHVVRMLGRSPSILRTTLEDYGVAMPVFRLLQHPDVDVKIAACGALCNLIIEVSPMRERFIEAGIVKQLCEHAHSMNAALRLNAMWALKALVHAAPNPLKKRCVEELTSGWLVQLICDDTEDEALFARMKSERRLYDDAGADDRDGDVEMDAYAEDSRPWLWSAMYRTNTTRSTSERVESAKMQKAEAKLSALREAELNPIRKARCDDLAIQEQGLNFIRNLITPSSSTGTSTELTHDTTEMVDYVFSELGQDRLFEILASKLRVKVLHPFSRRFSSVGGGGSGRDTSLSSSSSSSRVLYPQARIIEAVVRILVHIGASEPKHRQLVISQTELLKSLLNHFASKDKDVRMSICHLLTNLVWRDDAADAQACQQRALELKRLGFLSKLEGLEHEDGEFVVREQAKVAVWQMEQGST